MREKAARSRREKVGRDETAEAADFEGGIRRNAAEETRHAADAKTAEAMRNDVNSTGGRPVLFRG